MRNRVRAAIIFTVIVSALLFCTTAVNAAESGKCGDNITWTQTDDGVVTLSGTGEMFNYEHGESPFMDVWVTKVIVSEGITTIGAYAFDFSGRAHIAFEEITLPSTLQAIGIDAISSTGIKTIHIPDGVTVYGEAFRYNQYLETVTMGKNVTLEGNVFCDCNHLMNVTLPLSISSLDGTFLGCTSLTTIALPADLQEIGSYTFAGCENLTSIKLPEGLKELGTAAFSGCTSLTSINIPQGIKSIGSSAFSGCENLKNIDLPKQLEQIEGYAFYSTGIKKVTIPKNVSKIGSQAFGYKTNTLSGETVAVDGFVIEGYSGSASHRYAISNGINFISNGKIKPATPSIKKLYKGYAAFQVDWKTNNPDNIDGLPSVGEAKYFTQIQYSKKKNFKKATTVKSNYTSIFLYNKKDIKRKTKYYVRVRTCMTLDGAKYYSAWSKVKTVKTK